MGLFSRKHDSYLIERRKNGLYIKKLHRGKTNLTLLNDALADKDMDLDFYQTGWGMIVDRNHGKVYEMTDYAFNKFDVLDKRGACLAPVSNLKPRDFPRD